MAKLDKPFSIEQVKLFAGVVDFYYWKGIPVARAWPRKPKQPNTPAQVATRQHFAAAGAWMKTLPKPLVEKWIAREYPKGRTAKTYLRGLALRLANRGQLHAFPVFTSVTLVGVPTPSFTALRIDYDTAWDFDGDNVEFYYKTAPSHEDRLAWRQVDENIKKRCRSVGTFELNFDGFQLVPSHYWDQVTQAFFAVIFEDPEYIELFPVPKGTRETKLCLQPPLHARIAL